MFHQWHQQHAAKGQNPSERGRPSGQSSSILNELQEIESEIDRTIESRNASSRSTPPRPPTQNVDSGQRNSRNSAEKRDPPLTAEKYTEYFRQRREEEETENDHPKMPLVRFSEQLEIYTKHASKRGYSTPTVPILRTRIKGSGNVAEDSSLMMGSACSTSCGTRDPTPRSVESTPKDGHQQQRREPAGTTTHLSFPVSDPPVDRSRMPMYSPAALARPSSAELRPVEKGAFSLQGAIGRNGSLRQLSNRQQQQQQQQQPKKQNDVELNPRRLYADFASTHSQETYRIDLAPTPTNRNNSEGNKREELAPTPNNAKQRKISESSDDWATTAQRKPSRVPSPTNWNVAKLFTPTKMTNKIAGRQPTQVPAGSEHGPLYHAIVQEQVDIPRLPTTQPLPSNQQKAVMDNDSNNGRQGDSPETSHSHLWMTAAGNDSPSEESTESLSAYLINKYTKTAQETKARDEQLAKRESMQRSETFSLVREDTYSTPQRVSDNSTRLAVSDSKMYNTSSRGVHGNSKQDERKHLSYLQLEEDASLLAFDDGREAALPTLPKHIEVRMGDEFSPNSKEMEAVKPKKLSNKDRVGVVMKRIPKRRSPKVPFQSLYSSGFSYEESFENSQQDILVKQSTSDTDDSNSSIYRGNENPFQWDMFDKDSVSDVDDKNALIAARKKRRCGKTSMIWVLVCTVVVCLAGGLPTYFVMTSSNEEANPSTLPEEPVVMVNCANSDDGREGSFSERYSTIRQYLRVLSVGSTSMIDKPGTSQRKAVCWISEFDQFSIDVGRDSAEAIIQRYTLAVLYYAWLGAGNAVETGLMSTDFLASTHECDWDIIMCNKSDKVTALLLSDKDLQGSLPVEIGNLVDLAFLELSINQMTGVIPSSIQQLTALEYFAMAYNELSGSMPTVLGRMTSLQFLNLKSSQIQGTIPTEIGQLASLETLLLEGNSLTGSIPSSLGNLLRAENMSFERNYLSGKVAAELCELRDNGLLTELTVDYWIECTCCTEGT